MMRTSEKIKMGWKVVFQSLIFLFLLFPSAKVLAAPQIFSINPTSAGAGAAAKNISIIGTGFQCGVSVSFSAPSLAPPNQVFPNNVFNNQCGSAGVIPSNVQFFSSSNIFFYLNVSNPTQSGSVTLTLTNADGTFGASNFANPDGTFGTGTLTVPPGLVTLTFTNPDGTFGTAALFINPPPAITSVSPYPSTGTSAIPTVLQGGTTTIQLNGTGFQTGATLSGSFKVNSLYVNGTGTQATANITVSSTASPSLNGIVLTNPDGGNTSFPSAFLVQWFLGSKTPAMTVYEDFRTVNGAKVPFDAFWNGAWSDEGKVLSPNPTVYNPSEMVLTPHPFLFQQIMGHQRNLTSDLEFQIWNNGSWGNQLILQSQASSKNYDMAFESRSGKGLVVYGTSTGVAYRQIFQTGSAADCDPALGVSSPCWGVENVLTSLPNSVSLYTARLLSSPDGTLNEILLAYLDSSGRLFIDRWNGSDFFSKSQSSWPPVSATTRVDASTFDLAYMQSSKTGMLAWLENSNGVPKSCLWNGTACVVTNPLPQLTGSSASTTNLFRIRLSADPDPLSNQIALGTVEMLGGSARFNTEIWNGTTWPLVSDTYPANLKAVDTLSNSLTPLYPTYDWMNFSLVWKPGSGGSRLFGMYTNSNGGVHYQIWDQAFGWNGDLAIPGIFPSSSSALPFFNSILFDSDPRSGDILGGMKSIDSLLGSIRWDGISSQWVEYKALTPYNTFTNVIPFGFSYFKNFPTIDPATSVVTGQQGSAVAFTINGTHFQSGAVVSAVKNGLPALTPSGQPVFSQTSSTLAGNSLSLTGTVALDAIPGFYDLLVTNPDRTLAFGNDLISVTLSSAIPIIYSVTPDNRGQNALNQTLTLSGYNLTSSFSLSFALPNGGVDPNIVVNTPQPLIPVTIGSIQQVTLNVDILASASRGDRDILINMGGQSYLFKGLFTVNLGPSILSVTPTFLSQGSTQNLVMSGNDFQTGASLMISNGTQTLGWNSPGGIPESLYQNRMTGNRFAFPAGSAPFVVVAQVSLLASLVDPVQVNGQVAIYDDNNGLPGNLIKASTITSLGQSICVGAPCAMSFNVTSPIILDTAKKYWILFNAEGLQTVIAYDSNQTTCNGDLLFACISVSAPYNFGTWPSSGNGLAWNPVSGGKANRYGVALLYQPVFGSPQIGASSGGSYNQMTGSNLLTLTLGGTPIKGFYFYMGNVDPAKKSATLAVYDNSGTGGAPGVAVVSGRINSSLQPNSFNFFSVPTNNFSLPAGTYWVLVNLNGSGTTLKFDAGVGITPSAVQVAQLYGTGTSWPSPFSATSLISQTRYSGFAVGGFLSLGSAAGTVTDGPDSNQMTGSQFTTTLSSNLVGVSFYVDTVDPANPLGSAAIYNDNNGVPGNLIVASVSQTLTSQAVNKISLPLTQLLAGKYWLMANVNGRGTTLTYDQGTSIKSAKKGNFFINSWPSSGATATTWAGGTTTTWIPYPGRRYAIGVVPDVSINNSYVNSSNVMSGGISVDPNAALGGRQVCVMNLDGGTACVPLGLQIVSGIKTNNAMNGYGSTSLAPYPSYRLWTGAAPWNNETAASVTAGGAVNWSVLKAFPNANLVSARPDEKILGTLSNTALTLQVWNGGGWISSFTATPPATFSRPFDISYESVSGRALAVYGISTSSTPQCQIWNGTVWSGCAINPANTTGNTLLWVRLEANPKTDELVLAYLSGDLISGSVTNAALHLFVWNGSAFVNENSFPVSATGNINLCQTCAPPVVGQMFDAAYEHASPGRAVVAWGITNSSTPSYVYWNGTVWSAARNANRAAGDTGTPLIYIKLSADPNSSRIAMGSGTVNGQYYTQIWNGTDWGQPASRYDLTTNPTFSLTGEWVLTPASSPAFGTQKVSFVMSDSASFTIPGNEVVLIGQKDSTLGIANVYLDGILKDRIDFYSPVPTEKIALLSLSASSTTTPRTLTIKPSGSKNKKALFSGGPLADGSVANQIVGSLFQAPFDASLSRLAVYLNTIDGTNPAFKIALYSDSGGVPGTLLGSAEQPGAGIAGAWNSVTIDLTLNPAGISLTSGTSYWILASAAGAGTSFSYSNSTGNPSVKSIKLGQLYGQAWPGSYPMSTAWTSIPARYYSFNGGLSDGFVDHVIIGVAPSISVDSADVYLNGVNPSPSAVSTDLLYNIDPAVAVQNDPLFNPGRNFDLAWEKDSGTLMTVFGSSRSINSCGFTGQDPFPYGTRFKRWDPTIDAVTGSPIGWTADELVPLVGRDLVPRWIQLIQEPSSNAIFLEIMGHPVTVYNPTTNPDLFPDTTGAHLCNVAENSTTHISDPTITHYHHYAWADRAWTDKEVLSTTSSGALQSMDVSSQTYTAFGESFMTAFNPDITPPAAVQDLIITGMTSTSVSLRWTAPGDDGNLGKVAGYTLAWSAGSSTNTTTALPTQFGGGTETFTIASGILPATTYSFSITSVDKGGNVSPLSANNPSVTTPGNAGATGAMTPAAIKDLSVVPGTLTASWNYQLKQYTWNVQLTWKAPTISSTYSGTGAAYDFRWSATPITDDTTFNTATPVLALDGTGRNGLSSPHLAGTREFFNFPGLPAGTTYFAIKTCGPLAMDSVTFRCAGNSLNISPVNMNSVTITSPTQCYPTMLNAPCVNNGGITSSVSPSAIADLAITSKGSNSMTLRWTAPANVVKYDIRYSKLQIVENGTTLTDPTKQIEFKNAVQVTSVPAPLNGGMIQSFTVTNLLSNTTGIKYYFAIKAINTVADPLTGVIKDNPSALSNLVSDTTAPVFDYTPPDQIRDLAVVSNGVNKDSVILSWTATGDDGTFGTAMQYDIRYSLFPIVDDSVFYNPKQTTQVINPPLPLPSGNKELFTVTGLDSNTLYYFAIKAIDKASNSSPISVRCVNCSDPNTSGHTALHSGYNLVSVPYRLSGINDPTSVFGNDVSKPVTIYQWNAGAYSIPSLVAEGAGYFLYATGNNSVLRGSDSGGNLLGTPETGVLVTVPLQTGWNMIGNPYLHPIFLQDACIKHGSNSSVPFGTAVTNGWVGNSIYSFNGTQYVPEIYLDPLGIKPPAVLGPWNGYWLQLLGGNDGYNLIYLDTPGACP